MSKKFSDQATNTNETEFNSKFEELIRDNFDPVWYLERNTDVAQAGVEPFEHWLKDGFEEGRAPSERIDICFDTRPSSSRAWHQFTWRSRQIWVHINSSPEINRKEPLFAPIGHYYSPIVDPNQLIKATDEIFTNKSHMHGVSLDYTGMIGNFFRLQDEFKYYRYREEKSDDFRYFYNNDFFGQGDALVLFAMIQKLRPRRVVEVGSGFSTAVILDALDFLQSETQTLLTCIDPYPERLNEVLRPVDFSRVDVRAQPVQEISLSTFTALEAGDILFLDTSHISKTGSDVNHEVFNIIPLLNPGVTVHFHDIFHAFEYPYGWAVEQNRSWNEQYLIRAFLMYNNAFEIIVLNDAIPREFANLSKFLDIRFLENPGGSLWMRKT